MKRSKTCSPCGPPSKKAPSACVSPCAATFNQASIQVVLDAIARGDLGPFGALLAPDATFTLNNTPTVVGRTEILAMLATGQLPSAFTIRSFRIGVAADGSSFVTLFLSVIVNVSGVPTPVVLPEMVTLGLNAQCLIQTIEEVLAFPTGT